MVAIFIYTAANTNTNTNGNGLRRLDKSRNCSGHEQNNLFNRLTRKHISSKHDEIFVWDH